MKTVRHYQLDNGHRPFQDWLSALKDRVARTAILRRVDRLPAGDFGEYRYLSDGVSELKLALGPGYRDYFAEDGNSVVLLLCAGTKRGQRQDIARAIQYWKDYLSRRKPLQ